MKAYDLILFDLDGTLTRSHPGVVRSIRDTLIRMKKPVPEEKMLLRFIGPPLMVSLETYCGITGETAEKFLEEYRLLYDGGGVYEASVYEGIFPMLASLRKAGYRLAVATSKPQNAALLVTDHFKLTPCFDAIVGSSADEKGSKQRVMQQAMENFHADPKHTLMIGDTRFDAEGAQKCGTDFLGVLYGYGSREEMEVFGAENFAETAEKIGEWILEP